MIDEADAEYSELFDVLRKNRMKVSFYKYGPLANNYGENLGNAMSSLDTCIQDYLKTGNTEKLVDAANYLMIEFMYPKHNTAHFKAMDNEKSTFVGACYRDIEKVKED